MGKPRVDDRRVWSGIIFINRNGLRWRDAPGECGLAKILYNRWKRWSDNGVFARIMLGLVAERAEHKTIMIDATYLKAHRTASSLRVKKGARARSGAPKGSKDQETVRGGSFPGEQNTKLQAPADAKGRPIGFFMSAGRINDDTGAAALPGSLPKAGWLLADRGYDTDWFREALKDKGINACIPGRKSRKKAVKYDKRRYKRRNRIEITFGHLKDWTIVGKPAHWTVF